MAFPGNQIAVKSAIAKNLIQGKISKNNSFPLAKLLSKPFNWRLQREEPRKADCEIKLTSESCQVPTKIKPSARLIVSIIHPGLNYQEEDSIISCHFRNLETCSGLIDFS